MFGQDLFPESSIVGRIIKVQVLVVDDDSTCLNVISRLLKVFNYQVETAHDASEAVSILRGNEGCFDIVLTNVYMPFINGVELQKTCLRDFRIPCILMSADEKESVVEGFGIDRNTHYIMKPPSIGELKNLWRHVVSSRDNRNRNKQRGRAQGETSSRPRRNRRDAGNDGGNLKRTKITWTHDLHDKFLEAIRAIGYDRAVPKNILEYMNDPRLTDRHISSHLQKYRSNLREICDAAGVLEEITIPTDNLNQRPSSSSLTCNQLPALAKDSCLSLRLRTPSDSNKNKEAGASTSKNIGTPQLGGNKLMLMRSLASDKTPFGARLPLGLPNSLSLANTTSTEPQPLIRCSFFRLQKKESIEEIYANAPVPPTSELHIFESAPGSDEGESNGDSANGQAQASDDQAQQVTATQGEEFAGISAALGSDMGQASGETIVVTNQEVGIQLNDDSDRTSFDSVLENFEGDFDALADILGNDMGQASDETVVATCQEVGIELNHSNARTYCDSVLENFEGGEFDGLFDILGSDMDQASTDSDDRTWDSALESFDTNNNVMVENTVDELLGDGMFDENIFVEHQQPIVNVPDFVEQPPTVNMPLNIVKEPPTVVTTSAQVTNMSNFMNQPSSIGTPNMFTAITQPELAIQANMSNFVEQQPSTFHMSGMYNFVEQPHQQVNAVNMPLNFVEQLPTVVTTSDQQQASSFHMSGMYNFVEQPQQQVDVVNMPLNSVQQSPTVVTTSDQQLPSSFHMSSMYNFVEQPQQQVDVVNMPLNSVQQSPTVVTTSDQQLPSSFHMSSMYNFVEQPQQQVDVVNMPLNSVEQSPTVVTTSDQQQPSTFHMSGMYNVVRQPQQQVDVVNMPLNFVGQSPTIVTTSDQVTNMSNFMLQPSSIGTTNMCSAITTQPERAIEANMSNFVDEQPSTFHMSDMYNFAEQHQQHADVVNMPNYFLPQQPQPGGAVGNIISDFMEPQPHLASAITNMSNLHNLHTNYHQVITPYRNMENLSSTFAHEVMSNNVNSITTEPIFAGNQLDVSDFASSSNIHQQNLQGMDGFDNWISPTTHDFFSNMDHLEDYAAGLFSNNNLPTGGNNAGLP